MRLCLLLVAGFVVAVFFGKSINKSAQESNAYFIFSQTITNQEAYAPQNRMEDWMKQAVFTGLGGVLSAASGWLLFLLKNRQDSIKEKVARKNEFLSFLNEWEIEAKQSVSMDESVANYRRRVIPLSRMVFLIKNDIRKGAIRNTLEMLFNNATQISNSDAQNSKNIIPKIHMLIGFVNSNL